MLRPDNIYPNTRPKQRKDRPPAESCGFFDVYNPSLTNDPKVIPHIHFHAIPKPGESNESGLVIEWPTQKYSKEDLAKAHEEIKQKLQAAGGSGQEEMAMTVEIRDEMYDVKPAFARSKGPPEDVTERVP